MPSTGFTVLGAGDAFASKGLFQAGYLIRSSAACVLVDAGPTVLTSMKRSRIAPDDIDLILISHLHGDHFAGLPFLIMEYLYESPRRRPLTIAGPRDIERRTWALCRAMYSETDYGRIARKLRFVVLEPGVTRRLGGISVRSIRTPHTVKEVSLAFRIGIDGKHIAYSGDTGWTEELVALSAGADLFVCECTYFESAQFKFHLNYPQIAANRSRFSARKMILTHLGREPLNHASRLKIDLAHDGMKIRL